MISSPPSTNRLAQVAFISAFLTFACFCVGVAPIPLTGIVCYPAAILLGAVSMLCGISALRQIRSSGERGRWLAWFSIWSGALTILAIVFLTTLTFIILLYGVDAIHTIWPHNIGPNL